VFCSATAAKARELNLEEWERMDKIRKEKDIGGRRRPFSEGENLEYYFRWLSTLLTFFIRTGDAAFAPSASTSVAAAPVVSVPALVAVAPAPVLSSRDWRSDTRRKDRDDRGKGDDRDRFGRDRAEQDRDQGHEQRGSRDLGAAHYDRDKSLEKVHDRHDNDSVRRGRGGVECADGYVRGCGNIRDAERILPPPTGGANGRNRF